MNGDSISYIVSRRCIETALIISYWYVCCIFLRICTFFSSVGRIFAKYFLCAKALMWIWIVDFRFSKNFRPAHHAGRKFSFLRIHNQKIQILQELLYIYWFALIFLLLQSSRAYHLSLTSPDYWSRPAQRQVWRSEHGKVSRIHRSDLLYGRTQRKMDHRHAHRRCQAWYPVVSCVLFPLPSL